MSYFYKCLGGLIGILLCSAGLSFAFAFFLYFVVELVFGYSLAFTVYSNMGFVFAFVVAWILLYSMVFKTKFFDGQKSLK